MDRSIPFSADRLTEDLLPKKKSGNETKRQPATREGLKATNVDESLRIFLRTIR